MSENYCEKVAEAIRAYTDARRYVVDYVGEVNDYLDWLPPGDPLVNALVQGVKRLTDEMRKFHIDNAAMLDNTGNPCRLDAVAASWDVSIAKTFEDIKGRIHDDARAAVDWTGDGARAYEKVWGTQREKLADLESVAVDISVQLKNIANAIENFWVAVGIMLVSFAAAVASALAANVPAVVAALLSMVVAVAGEFVTLKAAFDTFELSQDALDRDLRDLGKEWPTASKHHAAALADPGQWEN